MKYLSKPIAYLEDSDFDEEGNLVNPEITDETVVIMVQANYCGFCTLAKPAFQEFADKMNGKVFVCTIQGDGDEKGEKELKSKINKWYPDFKGYPHYLLYKGGKRVNKENRGREVVDLIEFSNV